MDVEGWAGNAFIINFLKCRFTEKYMLIGQPAIARSHNLYYYSFSIKIFFKS